MSRLPPALVIAGKDLRQRLRDRSALVLGLVAPLVISGLMSVAFRGAEDFHAEIAVVDADGSDLSGAFVEVLRSSDLEDILTVLPVDDVDAAEAMVDDGDAQAGVVIPSGFEAAVAGEDPLPITVLTSVDASLAGEVVESIAASFLARVDAGRLSVATALTAGVPVSELEALAAEAAEGGLPAVARARPTSAKQLTMISYYAPSMAMFFAFFAISFGARGWFAEASGGTLQRMSAAVRSADILLGKGLAVYAYSAASLLTIAVVTSVFFGADWGGPLPAVALLLAFALAVVCLTSLVTVLARTERQADGIASIVTFALAIAGGSFISLAQAPPLLRRLSLFTPNGWATRAFTDLATGAPVMDAVVVPLAAIGAFSAVVGVLAALLAWRRPT